MKGQGAILQAPILLSDKQVESFHADGFVVLSSIASPGEIERLRVIYDRLFETRAGRNVGDFYDLVGTDDDRGPVSLPQLMNPSRYAPEMAVGQFRENASAIARQLLGPECAFVHDFAICKPARSAAPTPWHQDFAYHDARFDTEGLTFWIPLQEATLENGCLQFIPKSHLSKEVLPHHSINDDPAVEGLECDAVDASAAVLAPLPMGGASIHHIRTLHYAGPNTTQSVRRAYILEFRLPLERRAVARDHYWQRRNTNRAKRAATLNARIRNKLFHFTNRFRKLVKPKH